MSDAPDLRRQAMEMIHSALEAVDPQKAVLRHLRLEDDTLTLAGRSYDLKNFDRLLVVGGGKAGAGMAAGVETLLGGRISGGAVNVRHGYEPSAPLHHITITPAGHPIPDDAGLEGTQRMLEMLTDLGERDLVIVLISGGASALLEKPAAGISLQELQQATDALLACGATINEMNAIRKHLSQVKGGLLARRIAQRGAQAAILILSDVVGSPLDVIGSGPCVPDLSTFEEACEIVRRYGLQDRLPKPVVRHLEEGRKGGNPETPKPGDPIFEKVHTAIIGDNRAAAQAALETARRQGFNALLLTTYLEGEAAEVGKALAAFAREEIEHASPLSRPAGLIFGGETTVTLRGKGKGGRNQELALAAAIALEGYANVLLVALASDGSDGPTDAAGAIISGDTARRARQLGFDPTGHLARNDSYPLLAATGDLIMCGPTGTNVNDLIFILVA